MGTDPSFAENIVDLLGPAGAVNARKMFGEYGLYLDGKMVGLICDDTLFIKPVPETDALTADLERGSPYPNAKPHPIISEDRWDDMDWLIQLLRQTCAALPMPKPKKPKVKPS